MGDFFLLLVMAIKYVDKKSEWYGYYASLVVNATLLIIAIVVFSTLRKVRITRYWLNFTRFYAPRLYSAYYRPPKFSKSKWKSVWPIATFLYRHKDMLETHGVDSVVYTNFILVFIVISLIISLIGIITLIPILLSVNNSFDVEISDLNVSALPPTGYVIVNIVYMTIYSFIFYCGGWFLYYDYFQSTIRCRNQQPVQQFSVWIQNIPPELRERDELELWLSNHYAFPLIHVKLISATKQLYQSVSIYESAYKEYQRLLFSWKKDRKTPYTRLSTFLYYLTFTKVKRKEAMPLCKERLEAAKEKITSILQANGEGMKCNGIAIATFSSEVPARSKVQTYESLLKMRVSPAPLPSNIIWESLHVNQYSFFIRFAIISLLVVVGITFWGVPSAFLVTLGTASVDTLCATGVVVRITNYPCRIATFAASLLPLMVALLASEVWKYLCSKIVTRFMGFQTRSSRSSYILVCYYLFIYVGIFLLSTVSVSILDMLNNLDIRGQYLQKILTESFPHSSQTWLKWVLITALGRIVFKLFRVGALFDHFYAMFWCKTVHEKRLVMEPSHINMEGDIAMDCLTIGIFITFSVISPLLSIICLVYFIMSYFTHKYNLLYAHGADWIGGGEYFTIVFTIICIQIGFWQFMTTSMVVIKTGSAPYMLLLAYPLFTFLFWYYCMATYHHASKYGLLKNTGTQDPPTPNEAKHYYLDQRLAFIKSTVIHDDDSLNGDSVFPSFAPDLTPIIRKTTFTSYHSMALSDESLPLLSRVSEVKPEA